jgi:PAS domain S-box-containing protein
MRLPQKRFFNLFQEPYKKEVNDDVVAADDIAVANVVLDMKGHMVDHGNEFADLLGYSKAQLKHASIWKHITHPSAVQLRHVISQLSPTHPFTTTDITLIRKDMSSVTMEMAVNYYTSSGHEQLFCLFRNANHDRRILNELTTLKDHYKLLAEHSAYVQILLNAEFKSLYISPSCKKLSGFTAEEAKLINMFSLVHPDDFENFWDQLTTNHPTNEVVLRFRVKNKDKSFKHVECQMHIIPDGFGQPEYFVLNLHDISRQRKYEQELIRAHNEAEAAHRMKNNFLASITHELRTPLNAIIGFSRILEQYMPTPESERYNQYIESSGLQLLSLIDNLLEYARIENNQLNISKEKIEIEPFFRQLSAKTRNNLRQFNKSDIELIGQWELDPNNDYIVTNHAILTNIFTNLLDNALKFTKEGYVRYGCRSFGIRQYLFFVEDSGIGIPSDAHEMIFEKFTQLDQSLSREYGGTGLGLTVTKRFVDLLGGDIWVISEKGKGASFFFKLPIGHCDNQ